MATSAQERPDDLAVLVVDDEATLAQSLAAGLAAARYRAIVATSGAEALRHLAAETGIGVVVTDVRMPDCDGLDLAQRILADREEAAALEVVVISGHATMETAATAVSTRVSALLYKPFRLATVLQAVEVAMTRARKRRATAAAASQASAQLAAFEAERRQLLEWLGQARERLAVLPDDGTLARVVDGEVSAIADSLAAPRRSAAMAVGVAGPDCAAAVGAGGPDPAAAGAGGPDAEALRRLRAGVERSVGTLGLLEELCSLPEAADPVGAEAVAWPDLVDRVLRFRRPDLEERRMEARLACMAAPAAAASPHGLERTLDRCLLAAMETAPPGGVISIDGRALTEGQRPWSVIDLRIGPMQAATIGTGQEEQPAVAGTLQEEQPAAAGTPQGLLAFQIARRRARALGGEFSTHGDQREHITFRLAVPAAAPA